MRARRCDTCPALLTTGHGHVSEDGRVVQCAACAYPKKPRKKSNNRRRP